MLMELLQVRNKEKKDNYKNKFKTIKKMAIRTYRSITVLSINGLNAPTKRYTLTEWIQKQKARIHAVCRRSPSGPGTHTHLK